MKSIGCHKIGINQSFLNYDLVLERSLFQTLINTFYDGYKERVPFETVAIDYKYALAPAQLFKIGYTTYGMERPKGGTVLKAVTEQEGKFQEIEILKLHGSLNFPKTKKSAAATTPAYTIALNDPYILPPISSKLSSSNGDAIWRVGLNRLRNAKNVVFVGYSLPRTDIYMQYFLKAALGPNTELNRIFVFDPVLGTSGSNSDAMCKRYESCFSEQLRSRIIFQPPTVNSRASYAAGTTEHFVDLLYNAPEQVLF